MRRSRGLTEAERWELGLFLAMLIVGCLCLTAIFHSDGLPKLLSVLRAPAQNPPAASTISPAAIPAPRLLQFTSDPAPQSVLPSGLPTVLPSLPPDPSSPAHSAAQSKLAKKTEDIRWYNGQQYRYLKTLKLRVTAYAPDARCCWPFAGTTTASGLSVKTNHGKLVAADTSVIPMHALVSVPGYGSGAPVPVLDRGGAIKGNRLDVLLPTFDKARQWGTRHLEVRIYVPVEE